MNWEELEIEVKKLADKVNRKPDIIIGIVRGGLIPARLLSACLGVKPMHCLTVKKNGEGREVTTKILEELKGKKVLLVEDILESGDSLRVAKEYLEKEGALVKTACLFILPETKFTSDFYLKKVKKIIRFPWEA